MSYLKLPGGIPDFSKAVISLWFRAPKQSVIAATQHSIEPMAGFPILQGIMPLMTFGRPQQSKLYSTPMHNVAVIHPYIPGEPDATTRYDTIKYVEDMTYDVDPSLIGLQCFGDGRFSLYINLQTADHMSLSAATFVTTRMDIWSGTDPSAPIKILGNGVVNLFPNVGVAQIQDASYVDNAQPEFFTVMSDVSLAPDTWHHLLLSFDVGGSISIGTPFASSTCRLWYAIDDEDYRGAEHLQPYRDITSQWGSDTLHPNAILTRNAWRLSGSDPNWEYIHYYQNHYVGLPSGSYSNGSIPSAGEMGFPASSKYVDGIFRCEMAEFQMWTGVTLDTGIESSRRAFVDFQRDEQGQPIMNQDGSRTLIPVNPTKGTENDPRAPAERLLGKKPEILLHGSDNWKRGHNTGTTGVEENSVGDTVDIPSGQFVRTAGIERYKPDPSLKKTST